MMNIINQHIFHPGYGTDCAWSTLVQQIGGQYWPNLIIMLHLLFALPGLALKFPGTPLPRSELVDGMMEEFAKWAVVCELKASPEGRRYEGWGGSDVALWRMYGWQISSLLRTQMKILQPPTVIWSGTLKKKKKYEFGYFVLCTG